MNDEEFLKMLEDCESDDAVAYLGNHSTTEAERRETIAFLIRRREKLRDCELEVLDGEIAELLQWLNLLQRRRLIEELACFKDILALHHRLIGKEDEKPRD